MRLSEALRVGAGELVSFVGAGGKSTSIRRIVREVELKAPVLVTTTTKIALEQTSLARKHIVLSSSKELSLIPDLMLEERSVLLTGEPSTEEPKLLGLRPEEVDRLKPLVNSIGGMLLVEADGARGRSLKAPAAHEPVLPSQTDLVVVLAGMDVIGQALNAGFVHRPEILTALLNLDENSTITEGHVAAVLVSEAGGLKGVPATAIARALLTRVQVEMDFESGERIARLLLREPRFRSVLLAALLKEEPVHKVFGRVAGIVLAAGTSTRISGPKQLIQWRGKPLVAHAIEAALAGGLTPVIVVAGPEATAMRQAISGYPVDLVENPEPESGQSSSVRRGMEELGEDSEAALFLLSDMPLISPALIRALVERHQRTMAPVVAPFADGQRGNPVLFDRSTFRELQKISGDRGGRALFETFPPLRVDWDSSIHFDVDTPDDLRKLRELE